MGFSLLRLVSLSDTGAAPIHCTLYSAVRSPAGFGRICLALMSEFTGTNLHDFISDCCRIPVLCADCTGSYMTLTGRWRHCLLLIPTALILHNPLFVISTCKRQHLCCGETQSVLNSTATSRWRLLVFSNALTSSSSLGHPSLVNCNSKHSTAWLSVTGQ